ncbi:unnamed protein product [Medioppia subpectinata]|uniref:Uncharacterized protein n=1 Tax=Medioppia subpectinata TaxID=1979941 RepID=A0A7R9L2Z3_9ACAR|nr:unnamed protein product [Medioppia subpectinata]CAG2114448.1 unnamed protein product [Medioppia subpectinata]
MIWRAQACDLRAVLSTGQGCDGYSTQHIIKQNERGWVFEKKILQAQHCIFTMNELADLLNTMTCVFQVLFRAVLTTHMRLYNDYVAPMFPHWKVPFPDGSASLDGSGPEIPDSYKRFQTFMGIVREFGDYLRPVNKQLMPANPLNLKDRQRLEGKVAVVTGADEAIGRDTAIELSKLGFKVIMGVTDVEAMERVLKIIRQTNESAVANITPISLDMSSLASVRLFADVVTKQEPKIDLLVNSGDEFSDKKYITKDGFERNFVENYLSHFLVTRLLIPNLAKSTSPRIINVSSVAHHFGSININDVNYEKGFYLPLTAYNQSKLAQVLFTRELAKRVKETDIHVYAVNPGVLRNRKRISNRYIFSDVLHKMSVNNIGVQGVLYVALEDKFKNESGHYYRNHERVEFLTERASDDVMAKKLWDLSSDYVKLETDVQLEPKDKMVESVAAQPVVDVAEAQKPVEDKAIEAESQPAVAAPTDEAKTTEL